VGRLEPAHARVLAPLLDQGNVRLRAYAVPRLLPAVGDDGVPVPMPPTVPMQILFYAQAHWENPVLRLCEQGRLPFRWTRVGAEQQKQALAAQAQAQAYAQAQAQQRLYAMGVAMAGPGGSRLMHYPGAGAGRGAPALLYPSVGAAGMRLPVSGWAAQGGVVPRVPGQAMGRLPTPLGTVPGLVPGTAALQAQYMMTQYAITPEQQQRQLLAAQAHRQLLMAGSTAQAPSVPVNKLMEVQNR
jgi:hypothetical protein